MTEDQQDDDNIEFTIKSEEDFENKNAKLETSYNILVTLGSAIHLPQSKSTLEVEQTAFFKSLANSDELRIPSRIVAAYYFAKKILNHYKSLEGITYDYYLELFSVCEGWRGFDEIEAGDIDWELTGFEELVEKIVKYVAENKLNGTPDDISRKTVSIWCKSLCEAYKKIISITHKYYDRHSVIGNIMHPHYRIGNAALILEDLSTEIFQQNAVKGAVSFIIKDIYKDASMVVLQNLFINQFVLAFMEGKSLGFMTETQYTIAEILTFNRADLVAWFITNEIQKISPLRYANADKDKHKKELFKLLEQDCAEYVNNTNDRTIRDTVLYYIQKLNEIKFNRSFTELDIAAWMVKIQNIMNIYNYFSSRNERSQIETMMHEGKLHQCRGMILGDSVSVGFGLAKDAQGDEQCYVKIIPRLLQKEMGIKVDIANCSVIGYETSHGKLIVKRELKAIKPHFVIISLGGNDAFRGEKVQDILKNLEEMISDCIATTKVIVALGLPQTFTQVDEKYRKDFADILPALKQKYDIKTIWLPDDLLIRENIQNDGLHFKSKIQRSLADVAVASIKPVLKEIESDVQVYEACPTLIPQICFSAVLQGIDKAYEDGRLKIVHDKMNQGVQSATEIILSYLNLNYPAKRGEAKTSPVMKPNAVTKMEATKNSSHSLLSSKP